MNLHFLPRDCFAHVLSFAYPIDACKVSVVSSTIRVLADSDDVWEKFLPIDIQEIVSRFVCALPYSSKKNLFLSLCNSHFIDLGKKIFSLDKSSGKKHYIYGARELAITWANNPLYWSWKPMPQSRFSEVVELRTICWLEIQTKINTRDLSPKTTYSAHLILKFADRAYGLDTLPSEISFEHGNTKSQGIVYLRHPCANHKNFRHNSRSEISREREVVPMERKDGWIEVELGRFYNSGVENGDVKMSLKEVTGEHLKGGLIVEGLELRPLLIY